MTATGEAVPYEESPDIPGEPQCAAEAYVDAHAFASADGEDWPTLTCCRLPDHDGLHFDEMNMIEWAGVSEHPGPWIPVSDPALGRSTMTETPQQPGPQHMDNPRACGAPEGWKWGYLPCGCANDGHGRHVR